MTDDHRYAILDVSNLAHRAWHTIPTAYWRDNPGTLFEALHKTCNKIENDLCVDTLAFCFDGGYDYRKNLYPEYKQHRKEQQKQASEEEQQFRQLLFDQLYAFRQVHLPTIGAKNIFYAKGVEADDLIASCVADLRHAKKVYIVSSDDDLLQLLDGSRVVCYRPTKKEVVNEDDFCRTRDGLLPCMYASAKAWAGCDSDNIEGLDGVGEKKAIKFILGKGDQKFRQKFFDNIAVYNRNIQLTKLPAPGTPACVVVPQDKPLDWDCMRQAFESAKRTPSGVRK